MVLVVSISKYGLLPLIFLRMVNKWLMMMLMWCLFFISLSMKKPRFLKNSDGCMLVFPPHIKMWSILLSCCLFPITINSVLESFSFKKVCVHPPPDVSNTIFYHCNTFLLPNPWGSAWFERHVDPHVIYIHLKVDSMWLAQVPQVTNVQGEEKGTDDWPLEDSKCQVHLIWGHTIGVKVPNCYTLCPVLKIRLEPFQCSPIYRVPMLKSLQLD